MATVGAEHRLQEQLHPVPLLQARPPSYRGQLSHAGSGSLRHTSQGPWSCLTSGLESECREASMCKPAELKVT